MTLGHIDMELYKAGLLLSHVKAACTSSFFRTAYPFPIPLLPITLSGSTAVEYRQIGPKSRHLVMRKDAACWFSARGIPSHEPGHHALAHTTILCMPVSARSCRSFDDHDAMDPLEAKCAFYSRRRHGPLTGDTCSCPRRPAHVHARHTVLIPGLEAYSSICIVLLAYDPSTESYQSDSKSPTDMLSKTRSCLQTSTISFRVNSHILITLCYVQLQPVFHNLYDLLPLSHAASTLISTS